LQTLETLQTLLSLEKLETLNTGDTAITGIIVDSTRLKDIENVTRCRDSRSGKQGRDDNIKQFSTHATPSYTYFTTVIIKDM